MAYCSNCGNRIEEGFEFCPACGKKVFLDITDTFSINNLESFTVCPHCGERMPTDSYYCLNCGYSLDENIEDLQQIRDRIDYQKKEEVWKNKWCALILCLIFGWMGAHKYYEGRIGLGIAYTVTIGFCGIGWLIDIIILIFKSNPYRVK